MSTKADRERREAKALRVIHKLCDLAPTGFTLIDMLDENKLDLLLIALGDGEVVIREQ